MTRRDILEEIPSARSWFMGATRRRVPREGANAGNPERNPLTSVPIEYRRVIVPSAPARGRGSPDGGQVLRYKSVSDPRILREQAGFIQALADGEKEAVGFLPKAAYDEAVSRGRLIAMLDSSTDPPTLAGFVLFSGVYPNARVQQVVTAAAHRRRGVASGLIRELVARLEARQYLRVTAAVADDLPIAQAFYEGKGFRTALERAGGATRGRGIVVRALDLANEHLLSVLEPPPVAAPGAIDLGLRARSAGAAPLYAMDLNLLFDAVRNGRERADLARRVVGAALAHRLRLATAHEFVVELERAAAVGSEDPLLALARQLPRLPGAERGELDALAATVRGIVFGPDPIPSRRPQAESDARHLAHAALARASGFLTSDGAMLDAREILMERIGIDVLSLDEFAALLDDGAEDRGSPAPWPATNLTLARIARSDAMAYVGRQALAADVFDGLGGPTGSVVAFEAVTDGGEIVGLAGRSRNPAVDAPARLVVHVRADHVRADLSAEALIHSQCLQACADGPITIEAIDLPGQATVRRAAMLQGFVPRPGGTMVKLAIGRPITPGSWSATALFTRRRTGLRLPIVPPGEHQIASGVTVTDPDGNEVNVALRALEDAIGPTLVAWPGRAGAIVPIERRYADDLLGTAAQASMFAQREAALGTRRTYLNSPRTASALRPGTPILFYESLRSGGRGAIVAAARVVDAVVVDKGRLPAELVRRSVVDDVDPLSASSEVLATTFDNVLSLPIPVTLATLRAIGAVGPQNLVTVTPIAGATLAAILDGGWPIA